MSTVALDRLSLQDYVEIVGEDEIEGIRASAENFAGKSVVHVNSSSSIGGGVAEILRRLVPLMNDVGLDAEWKVIEGTDEFFNVTKTFHNTLQGKPGALTEQMKEIYLQTNQSNAKQLVLERDYVVIHDPQPLALIDYFPHRSGAWMWRCHIDLSNPNPAFLEFLAPFIRRYDAAIFTMKQYAKKDLLGIHDIAVIPPSIDPLSNKNKPLAESQIRSTLERYDVDPENPIMTQVARFDPWKDPLGVIDVYRLVKQQIPTVQLLLVAGMASDDPEGWRYYEKTARYAGTDDDIHFLTNLVGVKDREVNAFQRASDVVVQKSIREGFGLSVTEALWKGIPVIGTRVGGIPLQVIDGRTGFLTTTVQETAEKTVYLLKHPEAAQKLGEQGREHILQNFLITRHLKDYLVLFSQFSSS